MNVAIRVLPFSIEAAPDATVIDAPSNESIKLVLANPVPTIVTVVPTAADDGLTTATAGVITVNATVSNAAPVAEIVFTPAVAVVGTLNVPLTAVGQACAVPNDDVVSGVEPMFNAVGVVPKKVTVKPVWPVAPDGVMTKMFPEDATLTFAVTWLVPSLKRIGSWPLAVG